MVHLNDDEKIRLLSGDGMWDTCSFEGKLPTIHMSDGPHGLRNQEHGSATQNNDSLPATCFPTESALACSFDPSLAALMASAIAEEAKAQNVSIVLGCGVNVKRSPLCGRDFEYFSEDPLLSGAMAAAYINAMETCGIGTSLKHFAANSQETHRQSANSQIDERALHEIYLPAFERAVKEGQPATVMASYNRLNGVYSCENKWLLTTLLRDTWGYRGTVISDWGACVDPVKAVNAGMDLEMPDSMGYHRKRLTDALLSGELERSNFERAVSNIRALTDKYAVKKQPSSINMDALFEKNYKTACLIACESAVLLKNEKLLPLPQNSSILIVGALAEQIRYQGGGSSHIHTARLKNAIDCLKAQGFSVHYVKGYHADSTASDSSLVKEALEAAENACRNQIPVLFFGGLTEQFEGEGYDRTTLSLPENQIQLFNALASKNPSIGFISFGGAPFIIPFRHQAKAILHMYLGGEAVAEALSLLISGKKNPCGKLAETFPLSLEDTPCHGTFATGSDDVEYRESIFTGYRFYDTFQKKVQFPFGFGLSYTTFAYSELTLTDNHGAQISSYNGGTLTVSFNITNTGNYYGKEIVQLYVKNPDCNYLRASRELRGFSKVALSPGETVRVSIELEERSFSIYDVAAGDFLMPSGTYQIEVSASIHDVRLTQGLVVHGVDYIVDDRKRLSEYFRALKNDTGSPGLPISREQFCILYGHSLSDFDHPQKGDFSMSHSLTVLAKHSFLGHLVLLFSETAVHFLFKGKKRDDPEVLMTLCGIREGTLDSVLCQSGGILPYRLGEAIVLSANGHPLKAFTRLFFHK